MAFDPDAVERAREVARLREEGRNSNPFPPAPDNVVALENRKSRWTVEECMAVASRRPGVRRVVIALEAEDGSTGVLCSDMSRKDMLWLAEQIRASAFV